MKTRGAVVRESSGQVGDPRHRHGGAPPGRGPVEDGGVGALPLRRPHDHRRPAAGHPADGRRPRGCRHRRRGRPEHARVGGRRSRHPVVPARLRALPLVRVGHAEPVRPRRQRAHRLPGGWQLPDVASTASRSARAPASPRSARTPSSTLRRASRSTRTCRSRRSACSAAVSAPDGARRSTPPRPGPATPSSSWASAASASTPCRAPATPARRHVIAVDPVEFKREKAQELGATHSFAIDGRGRRVRPLGDQRPGRRLRHRHGRRAQDRARAPRRSPPSARRAPSW